MVAERDSMQNDFSSQDDGWWASVLADEQRYSARPPAPAPASTPAPPAAKSTEPPNPMGEDWEVAKQLYHQDKIVELRVTGFNRGGLLVEGGNLYGFVPFSHLVGKMVQKDTRKREKELAAYRGRILRLKVIECVPEDGRIVFSERAALVEAGKRAELFRSLQPGQRIWGEVTNITDFGVFIDLGGVEGLVHISELSWGRVVNPGLIVQLNQRVEVEVLEILPERCRVALSLKRLTPNPWEEAEKIYAVNQVVPARITSLVSYGAFARLDAGLEGLIHASEIPLEPPRQIKDMLSEGQLVQVRVLHVDVAHQRLGLSLRLDA